MFWYLLVGQLVPLAQLVAYYAVFVLLLIWCLLTHFASSFLACSPTSGSVAVALDAASQRFSTALVLDCQLP